ncbi:MAG TPA: hypothetical protein VFS00_10160, partial [Polyangiaceae bacterium]|nr:hypothetical protein [Polyangiaceae bacterium]
MGPFAGSALLAGVLRAAREGHGARENHEFPRVLLASASVRSLVAGEGATEAVIESVSAEGAWLRSAGAEVLALACVTMHAHLDRIVAASGGGEWVSLVSL